MRIPSSIHKLDHTFRRNSPAILTALGVSGTIVTAYLVGKASYEAARILHRYEVAEDEEEPPLSDKEKVIIVWRLYIPATVAGVVTVGCIVGGAKAGARKTAAAYSLVSVSERAFDEYKDKVIEKFGEKKEQDVRDSIAQDRVTALPPSKETIIIASGEVLCCELHTMRYFTSTVETLRKAENAVNAKVIRENEATLDDFYYLVGLPSTSVSGLCGWDLGRMMELEFSAVISPDEKPCMAFQYSHIKNL